MPVGGQPFSLCWGEILWDLFPDGARLGGAPANVAFHLAQLGAHVALVSRVGADERGREATATLARRGVDTSLVAVDPERPTGVVEVAIDGAGDAHYTLPRGRAWDYIEFPAALPELLARSRALCYGTLAQRTAVGHDALTRALAAAPPSCLRVCDPNLRSSRVDDQVLRAALTSADVVKLNDVEADLIGERLGIADVCAWLLGDAGAKLVALTRGARGSVLLTRDQRVDHPGFAAAGGDNVGAGDAFTAVLVHLLGLGAPLERIGEAANRYAAHVASCRGATPLVPAHLIAEVSR